MRNNHPLDRRPDPPARPDRYGLARHQHLEKGSGNLLHNDNNMVQLRFEHLLNDSWTTR